MASVTIRNVTDLSEGVKLLPLGRLFAQNDKLAHTISVHIVDNGVSQDLTGLAAIAYFIRADDTTVNITGTITGSVVSVALPDACYEIPGHFSVVIKVYDTDHSTAVFWGDGTITRTQTDALVDPAHVVPDLSALLAQIATIEAAVTAANTAADNANAAAENANTAADGADTAAGSANTAADGADTAAESANTAAAAANAAAEAASAITQQIIDETVPHLTIGTVTTVPSASGASASITGTWKDPVLNLEIPRGLDGSGSVQKVGGVSPDGTGNVPISVSGVSPNASTGNIPLTISTLGGVPSTRKVNNKALSSDITLTASDVGALPADTPVLTQVVRYELTVPRYIAIAPYNGWDNNVVNISCQGVQENDVAYVFIDSTRLPNSDSGISSALSAYNAIWAVGLENGSINVYAIRSTYVDVNVPIVIEVRRT